MTKIPARSVQGRDGWRFILRDPGQTVSVTDYEPVKLSRATRGHGPHYKGVSRYDKKQYEEEANNILDAALIEFKTGRFIYGDAFVRLCNKYGVKLIKTVKCQCKFMNELDVSVRTIRHKNGRGDYQRHQFNGMFSAIEYLVLKTIDSEKQQLSNNSEK